MARSRRPKEKLTRVDPPAGTPAPGGGGYFATRVSADSPRSCQPVCVWPADGGCHQAIVHSHFRVGIGPLPAVCDWVPRPWPCDHFPLGPTPDHLHAWFEFTASAAQDIPATAFGPAGPDNPMWGWRAFVRAARLLAVARRTRTADLAGRPLPADRDAAVSELLQHRDLIGFSTDPVGVETDHRSEPGAVPTRPTLEYLASSDLTVALGQPERRNAIECFLRRMADRNPDVRTFVEDPRKGKPRVLYRVSLVWDALVAHCHPRKDRR